MAIVNIYRSGPWQPLTRFYEPYLEKWVTRRGMFRCHECNGRRQARSLEISVDYDRVRIRCKDGKHPGWS